MISAQGVEFMEHKINGKEPFPNHATGLRFEPVQSFKEELRDLREVLLEMEREFFGRVMTTRPEHHRLAYSRGIRAPDDGQCPLTDRVQLGPFEVMPRTSRSTPSGELVWFVPSACLRVCFECPGRLPCPDSGNNRPRSVRRPGGKANSTLQPRSQQ